MSWPGAKKEWRTVPPQQLEEMLLLGGYALDLREGLRDAAMEDLRQLLGSGVTCDRDPGELLCSIVWQGLEGKNPFWRSRYVETGQRLAMDLWQIPAEGPPDLTSLPPRAFRVEFRRTFNLDASQVGSPVRLRMPLPVADEHLTDLTVALEAPSEDVRTDAGRIEAKITPAAAGPVTLAASFSFTAWPGLPRGKDDGADPARWLSEAEGPVQLTERVRSLAVKLDPEGLPVFDRVIALRDYLIDTMTCGISHSECLRGPATVDWVLDNGWFDCRTGSALLAALCRASKIPARLVGGYLLWAAPTEHYWIEAWLPDRGWTPFDLLAWDLSAGGRDARWRNIFAGVLDYRMKTQVLPDAFTGAPGVTMAAPWHRLVRYIPNGAETRYISIPSGDLLYADEIRVFRD